MLLGAPSSAIPSIDEKSSDLQQAAAFFSESKDPDYDPKLS